MYSAAQQKCIFLLCIVEGSFLKNPYYFSQLQKQQWYIALCLPVSDLGWKIPFSHYCLEGVKSQQHPGAVQHTAFLPLYTESLLDSLRRLHEQYERFLSTVT